MPLLDKKQSLTVFNPPYFTLSYKQECLSIKIFPRIFYLYSKYLQKFFITFTPMKILGKEITFNIQGESGPHRIEAQGIQFTFFCTQRPNGTLRFNIALGQTRTTMETTYEYILIAMGLELDTFILERIFSPDIAKLIADKFK